MGSQYSWDGEGSSASSHAGSSRTAPSTDSSELDPHEPVRSTRSEYAAYGAMLRDLDARADSRLARRLVTPRLLTPRLVTSRLSTADRSEDPSPLQFDGDELQNPLEARPRYPQRRPDKHPELSTRWPLDPGQLPPPPADLREAVISFAHAYIRQNKLVLPGHKHLPDPEDEQLPLPETLFLSTRQVINQTLVGLAALRPPASRKRARTMEPMGWRAVLGAASAINRQKETVAEANTWLRRIYRVPAASEDLLEHRLKILSDCRTVLPPRADLYSPILPRKDNATRRHQTQAELAKREEKRILRLEKQAEKLRQRDAKRKRRSRRC